MINSSPRWGYITDEPCVVCKSIPAQLEPRFGYAVCQEHKDIPPIKIYNYIKSINNKEKK